MLQTTQRTWRLAARGNWPEVPAAAMLGHHSPGGWACGPQWHGAWGYQEDTNAAGVEAVMTGAVDALDSCLMAESHNMDGRIFNFACSCHPPQYRVSCSNPQFPDSLLFRDVLHTFDL